MAGADGGGVEAVAWARPWARDAVVGEAAALLAAAPVVERQAKRVPEGHQRPLHGVGFCLLEGGLMGLAQVDVDAVAGTAALPNQGR